jgi:hypothetical protein
MSDEEMTQAMTDAVIFGTGVMQDGKRIDPLSFFVQPVSDPACEHCGMDPTTIAAMIDEAVQAEREACAVMFDKLAEDETALSAKYDRMTNPWFAHVQTAKMHRSCAAVIRARKGGEA